MPQVMETAKPHLDLHEAAGAPDVQGWGQPILPMGITPCCRETFHLLAEKTQSISSQSAPCSSLVAVPHQRQSGHQLQELVAEEDSIKPTPADRWTGVPSSPSTPHPPHRQFHRESSTGMAESSLQKTPFGLTTAIWVTHYLLER